MFYLHTFLARKGPLANMWIAAHLQHRLRKSHYTSTNIPSTVSKAFASIQLTLPENARKAPVHSITLPETFDLDALILDSIDDKVEDIHLRLQDDITLTDQIPSSMDYYVAITFDEDIVMDSSHTEVLPGSGARPMEGDVVPQSPLTKVDNVQVCDPSKQRESPAAQHDDGRHPHNIQDPEFATDLGTQDAGPRNQVFNSSLRTNNTQVLPEIEVLRDADNDASLENLPPPIFPDLGDYTGPSRIFDQTMSDKDHILAMVDDLDFGSLSVPSRQHSHLPTPDIFQGPPEIQVSLGHESPDLVLRSTLLVQQPQNIGRKRKQFFDTATVLTNKFIKALDNTVVSDERDGFCLPLLWVHEK